jgi:hypothetical protein
MQTCTANLDTFVPAKSAGATSWSTVPMSIDALINGQPRGY